MTRVRLSIDNLAFVAELNNSATATALLEHLPLRLRMSRWGDEYYADVGVPLGVSLSADARDELAIGDLAYWPPGNALCLFFGPTPASLGDEPRAASDVNPLGRVVGDLAPLRELGGAVDVELTLD